MRDKAFVNKEEAPNMFCVERKSVNQWNTRDNFSCDLPIEQVKFEAKKK